MLVVLAANLLAIALRFDFNWSVMSIRSHRSLELLLIDFCATAVAFSSTGLYQGYWKYASLDDLSRLARATGYRTVALIVTFYGLGFYGLSRAIVVMSTLLLLVLAGGLRLAPRVLFEFTATRRRSDGRRTLIIGAGDSGESLLRELKKSAHLDYLPVGFVDDDPDKAGAKIHGVPILGSRLDLERIIRSTSAQDVIIAIPGASGAAIRQIVEVCARSGARLRTVPTRGELERGAVRISQIRLVDVEDLLGRDVVSLNQRMLREALNGRRILITGAAGSIGRELARQVSAYGPAELILLDRSENSLFYLEAELRDANPSLNLDPIVGDVADRSCLRTIFEGCRPEVIFHAAAYKHVPLMEQNPIEAIKNNVIATRHLAEAAVAAEVERFIYVSTDKAVRPTSVMGATKRLGERLIKSAGPGVTRFMAVRFGNVLGSDGSVVPTFRRQIAAGGPVTVTHPETSRYFMTIPEAVQLVLMAGAMGEGGEVFLLQMGQPIRIVDLARNLISLSGLRPDEDIQIVFTGLRPGEKLHEELKSESETALPTSNEKIMVLTGIPPLSSDDWQRLTDLEHAAAAGDSALAFETFRGLVPEYEPAGQPRAETGPVDNVVGITARRRLDAQV